MEAVTADNAQPELVYALSLLVEMRGDAERDLRIAAFCLFLAQIAHEELNSLEATHAAAMDELALSTLLKEAREEMGAYRAERREALDYASLGALRIKQMTALASLGRPVPGTAGELAREASYAATEQLASQVTAAWYLGLEAQVRASLSEMAARSALLSARTAFAAAGQSEHEQDCLVALLFLGALPALAPAATRGLAKAARRALESWRTAAAFPELFQGSDAA